MVRDVLLVPEDSGSSLFPLILIVLLAQVSLVIDSYHISFLPPTKPLLSIEGHYLNTVLTHNYRARQKRVSNLLIRKPGVWFEVCCLAGRHWLTLVSLDPDCPSGPGVQQQRGRGENKR